MRHPIIMSACLGLALAGCAERSERAEVERALQSIDAIDSANLAEIMLDAGDPDEAVAYFQTASAENPDRVDLRRGLATALVRAKQPARATSVWRQVVASPGATSADRVEYADALIRSGDWSAAKTQLDSIPPTFESYERYRLEAMVADGNQQWDKADSFYQTAAGLTTTPASVLNNWGYSKLSRGDYPGAERLFAEALSHDEGLFTAKNNLVLARGAQRNYTLPVVRTTQTERAQLLHTMALAAIKQGDVATGQSLLREAVETHPQHFEAAARALDALDANVAN
ncbi:Flp pilus assembly protein TadD [Palleronia aestuarii]|uniref:Flp pilus assembly protein TadD n=1 Tax=Palleronia aestuarii TaxID=568105 RepID=A0A2W7NGZ1_9RHOB|nr:tetratricopeptide repeat protein [Palleronia aestuarii]PZX19675.1 Flp pilus assembly protein TadD [Palleronia aestuarii]